MSESEKNSNVPVKRKRLDRDQRRDILLMRSLGYTYQRISDHLHISYRAVQYTCEAKSCEPGKPGPITKLSEQQMDEVERFIISSPENRQLSYAAVIESLRLSVKPGCLRQQLQKRGYSRRKALPNRAANGGRLVCNFLSRSPCSLNAQKLTRLTLPGTW